ncbi:MAG: hypothetical protein ACRC33_13080 [Gemmataceae bacterium]
MATATTPTATSSMLTAVFRNHRDARSAYDRLLIRGYTSNEISLLMSESTRKVYTEESDTRHQPGNMAEEGMGIGGAIGTAVGATAAAIAMIGTSLIVPGIGVVAGPIAAALAGGGAGAVTGGVLGGLIGLGITEPNAKAYEEVLRNGGVVVGVRPHDSEDSTEVRKDFEELGGENICNC